MQNVCIAKSLVTSRNNDHSVFPPEIAGKNFEMRIFAEAIERHKPEQIIQRTYH